MPWKETCAMDQRMQLIGDWLRREFSITELSRVYGVSRPTVYKWIGRYRERGSAGLEELARQPLNHPNATPADLVEKIVTMKLAHQKMGPKKIIVNLQRQYSQVRWPAVSTAGEILKRQGLVRHRKRRRRVTPYTDPLLACGVRITKVSSIPAMESSVTRSLSATTTAVIFWSAEGWTSPRMNKPSLGSNGPFASMVSRMP
jgi:transposase